MDAKEPSFPVPPAFPEADVCLHHPHTLQEMALPTLTSSITLVPFEHGGTGLRSQAGGVFGRTGYQGIGVKKSSRPGLVPEFFLECVALWS